MISKARTSMVHGRRWALLATLLGVLALLAAQNHGGIVVHDYRAQSTQSPRTRGATKSPRVSQPVIMSRHESPHRPIMTTTAATPTSPYPPSQAVHPSTTTTTKPTAIATTAANLDPTIVETGWLEGPQIIEADYPLTSPSTRSATLTWSSSVSLTLRVTCGTQDSSISGTSPLTIALSSGSCTVSIIGSPSIAMTSYRLEVAPT